MRRSLLCLIPALLSAGASAQTERFRLSAAPRTTVQVQRLGTVDTRSFRPAVVNPYRAVTLRRENPAIRSLPARDGAPSLPVGGLSDAAAGPKVRSQFPGIGFTDWLPPDPDMAVGPRHIVVGVNMAFGIYSKSGVASFRQDGAAFFGQSASGDPKCIYDAVAKRYMVIMMQIGNQENHMLLAVSDDDDPNGVWHKFRIESNLNYGGRNYWMDYPGFGVSNDAVVICGNMFGYSGAGGFAGNQFLVLPKASLLQAGSSPLAVKIHDPNSASIKFVPSADGAGDTLYGMATNQIGFLSVYAITGGGTANPLVQRTEVPSPVYDFPFGEVPGPSGTFLDQIDDRLFNLSGRRGRLVAAHNAQSGSGIKTMWYEVNLRGWPASGSTPALTQSGEIKILGSSTHMAAVALNGAGDMGALFSRTDSATTAELMLASRAAADAAGTLSAPVSVARSTGLYQGERWGDYFAVVNDPVDDSIFWGYGMVGGSGYDWNTFVTSFSVVTAPVPALDFTLESIRVPVSQGGGMTGGLSNLRVADGRVVAVASITNKASGRIAALETTHRGVPGVGGVMRLKVLSAAVAGGTREILVWNVQRGRYDVLATGQASGATASLLLEGRASQPYFGVGGKVQTLVRITRPASAGTFELSVDLVSISPTRS